MKELERKEGMQRGGRGEERKGRAGKGKGKCCWVQKSLKYMQHAQFLHHLSDNGFNYCEVESSLMAEMDTQEHFDAFYSAAHELMDRFYPESSITVSSRDPHYLTPAIKAKLRRRNRLHRAGRVDEANALAQRIGIREGYS